MEGGNMEDRNEGNVKGLKEREGGREGGNREDRNEGNVKGLEEREGWREGTGRTGMKGV